MTRRILAGLMLVLLGFVAASTWWLAADADGAAGGAATIDPSLPRDAAVDLPLIAAADEGAPDEHGELARLDVSAPRPLVVPRAGKRKEGDPARGSIRGLLTDSLGQPHAGRLRIHSRRAGGPHFLLTPGGPGASYARAGPDGRFVFEGLRPGPWEISVDATSLAEHLADAPQEMIGEEPHRPDDPALVSVRVKVEAGVEVEAVVAVPFGAFVEGRLLAPDGTPVAHHELRLASHEQHMAWTARTRADGVFLFQRITPGRFLLVAQGHPSLASSPWLLPEPLLLRVVEGGHHVVDLYLVTGHGLVRGRVVDQHGEAYGGVVVSAVGTGKTSLPDARSCVAGEDGRFELSGLPLGSVRIEAVDPPLAVAGSNTVTRYPSRQKVVLEPGRSEVELAPIVLLRPELFLIHGRVDVEPSWGSAQALDLDDVVIHAVYADSRGKSRKSWARPDSSGLYVLECESPTGAVTVTLAPEAHAGPFEPRSVAVPAERTGQHVQHFALP